VKHALNIDDLIQTQAKIDCRKFINAKGMHVKGNIRRSSTAGHNFKNIFIFIWGSHQITGQVQNMYNLAGKYVSSFANFCDDFSSNHSRNNFISK
jgi:hypothetical protein